MKMIGNHQWLLSSNVRGQDRYKNSGSHVGPSDANFGHPHQIPVAHLIIYFFHSYENLTTHDTLIIYLESTHEIQV